MRGRPDEQDHRPFCRDRFRPALQRIQLQEVPRSGPLDAAQVVAFPQIGKTAACTAVRGDADMTISIPLIALAAIIAYLAYRYMGLRVWHAIVCALLGFLLAATSAAPQIRDFISGIVQWFQASGKG